MKKHILILLLFFITKGSFASYMTTYYPTLVEDSKIIAYGKIISVETETFKIVILKNIKQCKRFDTLTIQKFANWTCATRYAAYKTEQEGVFFMQLSKEKKLIIMGAANEGEIITKNDVCYLNDYESNFKTGEIFDFISKYSKYIHLPLKTVEAGIKVYLEEFKPLNYMPANNESGTVAYKYEPLNKNSNVFYNLLYEQKSLVRKF